MLGKKGKVNGNYLIKTTMEKETSNVAPSEHQKEETLRQQIKDGLLQISIDMDKLCVMQKNLKYRGLPRFKQGQRAVRKIYNMLLEK
jgi:hypothetical protein